MELPVRFTRRTSKELHRIADWYNDQSAGLGAKWLRGIQQAIASLSENPERCGLSHEADLFPFELHELHYGVGRRKTHRVLFRIVDDEVVMLGIRHFSQQDLNSESL
ncbi:MAG: type II toxin-antitoxin system RelE/ParE family toxin [Planctomycetes bacterium]|nr:type II toxin-antitoxin system RelE/ParE family toxin [Planctomycetota bacterium]